MDTYLEFIGNNVVIVAGLFASFFLLVFTELKRKADGIVSIDPQEAVKLINADATVIDLRPADAFARGHIVNARNIPHDEIDDELEKLSRFKGRPMVAVCEAGMTSSKIVSRLRQAGIDNAYGLKGGIGAWNEASLPLVSSRKTRSKKKS